MVCSGACFDEGPLCDYPMDNIVCRVRDGKDGWVGEVWAEARKYVPPGGAVFLTEDGRYCKNDPTRTRCLFNGPPRSDAGQAGADAVAWCQSNQIVPYQGPVMSGHGDHQSCLLPPTKAQP